jgi:hypothetical protein
LALPVVVAAPVGALPGTRHVVWQLAACALHAIMQLVTVELCASRTLAAACAATDATTSAGVAAKTANSNDQDRAFHRRMTVSTSRGAIIAPAATARNHLLPTRFADTACGSTP